MSALVPHGTEIGKNRQTSQLEFSWRKLAVWNAEEWNYRTTDMRIILIKGKNVNHHMILAEDATTRLLFNLEVPNNISVQKVKVGREYTATFKIHTAKSR